MDSPPPLFLSHSVHFSSSNFTFDCLRYLHFRMIRTRLSWFASINFFLETCGPNSHSLHLCLKFINTICYGTSCLTAHKSIKIYFFFQKKKLTLFAHFAHKCYMCTEGECAKYSRVLYMLLAICFGFFPVEQQWMYVIFSGLRIFCLFVPDFFFSCLKNEYQFVMGEYTTESFGFSCVCFSFFPVKTKFKLFLSFVL